MVRPLAPRVGPPAIAKTKRHDVKSLQLVLVQKTTHVAHEYIKVPERPMTIVPQVLLEDDADGRLELDELPWISYEGIS